MLEHVPSWLGALLHNVRAGHSKLTIVDESLAVGGATLDLSSAAFASGDALPSRFTADGAGVSPPLAWEGLPEGTEALVLIVEDPDAPFPRPVTHALVWNIPPAVGGLQEGAIGETATTVAVGQNSRGAREWLPPDPPSGHGDHDYVFQLFALSARLTFDEAPDRAQVVGAMAGKVIAAGLLSARYGRP
jgi:Raf kinase inhibitor-like YbhB/YbcL family protein